MANSTKTVLVLGAAGRVGKATAQAFLNAGYRVRTATRDGRSVLPGAEPVKADAMDVAQLRAAFAGADIIFNGLNPPYEKWQAVALPMARNVMEAMRGSAALHLFPGNVYAFGSPMPPVLREDTPQRPTALKGQIRVDMEALFAAEAKAHVTRTIVLRAGDFFGGKGGWFDQAVTSRLTKGVFVAPGPMELPHAWAYLPDLAATFVRVADVADQLEPFTALHFPGHTTTLAELKRSMEAARGKPLKTSALPWWLIRLSAPFMPMNRELLEMRYLWQEPHQLQSARLARLIGEVPHTPLDEAIRQTLAGEARGNIAA